MNIHKLVFLITILLASFFASSTTFSQKKDTLNVPEKLTRIEESISEIRRDQLNYRIERDLLKEAFSSNYQTINIVLAIILGVFSVIGFLGIRDIGTIRRQYFDELNKLNDLRRDFEARIAKYQSEQDKVKEDYFTVLKTNEEQNRRIKVLELQEKVGSLMRTNNYQRALEYAIPALEMDPNNQSLLEQKGLCLWRLRDMPGAITTFAKLVEIDQNNFIAVSNLLEIYLITNRLDDFRALYQKNKAGVTAQEGAPITTYFEVLEAYQQNDVPKIKNLIQEYIKSLTSNKEKRTAWDFSDAQKALSPKSDEARGALLNVLVAILTGELDREEATKKLGDSE
jgi:tetratricopeptide (TPR) repeat protein